jgi:hypothetical protein
VRSFAGDLLAMLMSSWVSGIRAASRSQISRYVDYEIKTSFTKEANREFSVEVWCIELGHSIQSTGATQARKKSKIT